MYAYIYICMYAYIHILYTHLLLGGGRAAAQQVDQPRDRLPKRRDIIFLIHIIIYIFITFTHAAAGRRIGLTSLTCGPPPGRSWSCCSLID